MAKRITELTLDSSPDPLSSFVPIDSASGGTLRTPMSQFIGTKVKVVNAAADFPAPVATVVTLEDDTAYIVGDKFSMSDRIVVGARSALIGYSPRISEITYTGSGTFITVTNTTFNFNMIGFDCASGTFISADSTGLGFQFVTFDNVSVASCIKLGTLTNIGATMNTFTSLAHDDGLSWVGTIDFLIAQRFFMIGADAGSIGFDLGTATFGTFECIESEFGGLGTGLSGAAASANIAANIIATMNDVEFNTTTALSGVARDDFRWEFKSCANILNSHRVAEADLSTTETVDIITQSVYVQVGGSNWTSNTAESFTVSTAGAVTYIGEITRKFYVGITATIEKVGGGADEICLRIGQDTGGGFSTEARTTSCTQNATPTSVYSHGIFDMDEDDVLAAFVANNAVGIADIDVTVSSFIVFELP